jgi:hypothetical protein
MSILLILGKHDGAVSWVATKFNFLQQEEAKEVAAPNSKHVVKNNKC